jgi:hypothetical protein
MEKEYGGSVADATTRFIVDKYETSYGDGFIIMSMWDENGHAYMASVRTEDALRMATQIRDIAVDDLEGEAAEGAL